MKLYMSWEQARVSSILNHRHRKRAGVIFSIDWVAWGKTGC